MVDRGDIDTNIAYYLAKISDDRLKLLVADAIAKYKYIPRDVKIEALKEYLARLNEGVKIRYSPIVLELFKQLLASKYPIFNRVDYCRNTTA